MFFRLRLPALRERSEDLPGLIAHFARQVADQNGWKEKKFGEAAVEELQRYSWPGNVRELRNVVERLILLSAQNTVAAEDVRLVLPAAGSASDRAGRLRAQKSAALSRSAPKVSSATLCWPKFVSIIFI